MNAETVVRRWFDEVWNAGSDESIDLLLAEHGIAHGLGQGESPVVGPAGFRVFLHNMRAAIPDVNIEVLDVFATEDRAATRVVLRGTHLGEGLGLPPTGNSVAVNGIVIMRVEGDQIVEGWNSWDQLGFMRQLGAIPAIEAAERMLAE